MLSCTTVLVNCIALTLVSSEAFGWAPFYLCGYLVCAILNNTELFKDQSLPDSCAATISGESAPLA